MKIAKFFSAIFAAMGAVLLLGTVGLCLVSLDAGVKLVNLPDAAVECSEQLMQALEDGDYDAAGNLMYGQPDLGADREPENAVGSLLWSAFVDSFSYAFQGSCYATDSGIFRDASITVLDVASVTDTLTERAQALLEQRVEQAEELSQLYDEQNNFREDLVSEVLLEAAAQALAQDARTVTYDVTLSLICRDDQWWVVPDQTLLLAISGSTTGR